MKNTDNEESFGFSVAINSVENLDSVVWIS